MCFFSSGATEEPEVIPDPAKQTDQVVKIAGISAAVLVFILLVLVAILLVKKRYDKDTRLCECVPLQYVCVGHEHTNILLPLPSHHFISSTQGPAAGSPLPLLSARLPGASAFQRNRAKSQLKPLKENQMHTQ